MNARLVCTLVALTLTAGYVDAVAFFGMGVFVANMTGNTVLLAGAFAERFVPALPGSIGILLPLLSIATFVAGAVGAALVLRGETGRPPVRTRAVLVVVAALTACCAALQHVAGPMGSHEVVIALLSAAMGLQSVAAVRAGIPGISTTFVTGTLVRAVLDFEGDARLDAAHRTEGNVNAAVWAGYLVGAFAGSLAVFGLGANALWLPAVVIAILLPVV